MVIKMAVHYKTFARFIEFFGKEGDIEISDNSSVLDILKYLIGTDEKKKILLFNDDGTVRRYVILLKNNERILNENVADIMVNNGDEITVYPPVSGG